VDYGKDMLGVRLSLSVEAPGHIIDNILNILEPLDLLINELHFELLLNSHRDIDDINLIEPQLMPLGGQLDLAHILHLVVAADEHDDTGGHQLGIEVVAWQLQRRLPERLLRSTIRSRFTTSGSALGSCVTSCRQ
jgi:hypothetical protein